MGIGTYSIVICTYGWSSNELLYTNIQIYNYEYLVLKMDLLIYEAS